MSNPLNVPSSFRLPMPGWLSLTPHFSSPRSRTVCSVSPTALPPSSVVSALVVVTVTGDRDQANCRDRNDRPPKQMLRFHIRLLVSRTGRGDPVRTLCVAAASLLRAARPFLTRGKHAPARTPNPIANYTHEPELRSASLQIVTVRHPVWGHRFAAPTTRPIGPVSGEATGGMCWRPRRESNPR